MTEKRKGLVMEITDSGILTVITPLGEFLSIAQPENCQPEIGCEIEFEAEPRERSIFFNRRWMSPSLLAVAACLLLLLASLPLWRGQLFPVASDIVAYVGVDINPSVELGINSKDQVKEAYALNEDGRLILQNVALRDLNIKEAVRLLTEEAIRQEFITEEKENMVVVTVAKKERTPEIDDELAQEVKKVLADNKINGQSNQLEVPLETREKAKSLGMTPGKYAILMEAVEEGLPLTVDDIKGNSIVKAIKNAGGIPGQVISRVPQDLKEYKRIEKNVERKLNLKELLREKEKDREKQAKPGQEQEEERLREESRKEKADSQKERDQREKGNWKDRKENTGGRQENTQDKKQDDGGRDNNSQWNDKNNGKDNEDKAEDKNKDNNKYSNKDKDKYKDKNKDKGGGKDKDNSKVSDQDKSRSYKSDDGNKQEEESLNKQKEETGSAEVTRKEAILRGIRRFRMAFYGK